VFQQNVTKVDGLHVLVHLWHNIHQDLLSINTHQNSKFPATSRFKSYGMWSFERS